jgi:hypothetical protein
MTRATQSRCYDADHKPLEVTEGLVPLGHGLSHPPRHVQRWQAETVGTRMISQVPIRL